MTAAEETFHSDLDALKDTEQALVFLDAWGTGETLDEEAFQGHKYVISDYAPEWVTVPYDAEVITLLSVQVGKLTEFEGYTLFGSFGVGEKVCPHVGDDIHTENCLICGGGQFLYWGEEWRLAVLVKEN